MQSHRHITLRHLLVGDQKMIGIQFYPDKVIQVLIKQLDNPKWSKTYQMVVIPNNKGQPDSHFQAF